jgi:hypothetical protein
MATRTVGGQCESSCQSIDYFVEVIVHRLESVSYNEILPHLSLILPFGCVCVCLRVCVYHGAATKMTELLSGGSGSQVNTSTTAKTGAGNYEKIDPNYHLYEEIATGNSGDVDRARSEHHQPDAAPDLIIPYAEFGAVIELAVRSPLDGDVRNCEDTTSDDPYTKADEIDRWTQVRDGVARSSNAAVKPMLCSPMEPGADKPYTQLKSTRSDVNRKLHDYELLKDGHSIMS